jgi:hypothetical protein
VGGGEYLLGVALFAVTLGAVLAGSALVARRRLRALVGSELALAYALVATLGLIAVHLLPALVGVMNRFTVPACALLALFACTRVRPLDDEPAPPPLPFVRSGRAGWVLALGAVALLAAYVFASAREYALQAPLAVDTLNFHLPGVARWIETGSIWQIDEFVPDLYFGNYPNSGDVVLLATVLPWRNDFLTHLTLYPFLALVVLAVYTLGRELRAPRAVSLTLGVALASTPSVAHTALHNAMPDAIMLMGFGAGATFLLRHHRTGRTADLVLGGLGIGLALGTKWYGLTCGVVLVAVWSGARLWAGAGRTVVLRQLGAVCGLVALAGGVWMLRNLILSGNPIFPQKVALFGVEIFDAPRDRLRELGGFSISDYLTQPSVWEDYLLEEYRQALALPLLVIGAGALAAAALAFTRWGRRHERGPVLTALAAFAGIAAVYSITPYTALGPEGMPRLAGANARYLVPGLILAAACAAWASGRLRRRGRLAVQAVALLATLDGLRQVDALQNLGASRLAAGAALTVLAALVVLWVRRSMPLPAMGRPRPALALAACVLLALLAAGGWALQERYNERRFLGMDPALDWLNANAPEGHRIGLAGTWTDQGISPVFPSFGPRLRNDVVYHGEFREEMLRRYGRREEFVAALRRERYDLLLVGRGRPPSPANDEERWARAAGYVRVAESERLALLAAPRTRSWRTASSPGGSE